MVIFHSYVKLPDSKHPIIHRVSTCFNHPFGTLRFPNEVSFQVMGVPPVIILDRFFMFFSFKNQKKLLGIPRPWMERPMISAFAEAPTSPSVAGSSRLVSLPFPGPAPWVWAMNYGEIGWTRRIQPRKCWIYHETNVISSGKMMI